VVTFTLTAGELDGLTNRIAVMNRHPCTLDCVEEAADHYLNDSGRFGVDSPYHSFHEFKASPLLSQAWKETYQSLAATSKPENCHSSCKKYEHLKEELIEFYSKLDHGHVGEVDAIIIPSNFQLPLVINSTRPPNSSTTFIQLATCMGYAALSVPVGASVPDKNAPQGLPMGAALISKPERLFNVFRIAKIWEATQLKSDLKRLPANFSTIFTKYFISGGGSSFQFYFIRPLNSLLALTTFSVFLVSSYY
jgi:hypothetical protein